jgi:Orsellinic acid/F9775 biosynthesis cluster protein D
MKCDACNANVNNMKNLKCHRAQYHRIENPCTIQGEHHDIHPWPTPATTDRPTFLSLHPTGARLIGLRPSPTEAIACPAGGCTFTFQNFKHFKAHVTTVHSAEEVPTPEPTVTNSGSTPPSGSANSAGLTDDDPISSVPPSSQPPRRHPQKAAVLIRFAPYRKKKCPPELRLPPELATPTPSPSPSPSPSPPPSPSPTRPHMPERDSSFQPFSPAPAKPQADAPSPASGPTRVVLDGSKSYLESCDLFDYIGVRRHTACKAIICVCCGHAVLPKNLYGHTKGHDIDYGQQRYAELQKILTDIDIPKSMDAVILPQNGGPPVELLNQRPDGHCCDYCDYCAPTQKAFDNHWSSAHKGRSGVPRDHRYHRGTLQTFFSPVGEKFFEVKPILSGVSNEDIFAIYLRDEVSAMPPFVCTLPDDPRDVNPLLRAMDWHVHLADFMKEHSKRVAICSLVKLPSKPEPTGIDGLGITALNYLKVCRKKGAISSFQMRCMLMEYPR